LVSGEQNVLAFQLGGVFGLEAEELVDFRVERLMGVEEFP